MTETSEPFLLAVEGGLLIRLHVQPKASATQITGTHGTALKIKVQAPPVEGAANKACQVFLAKTFKVSKSSVRLISGAKSREKTFHVSGISMERAREAIRGFQD